MEVSISHGVGYRLADKNKTSDSSFIPIDSIFSPIVTLHDYFKAEVIKAQQGSTILTLKELTPVRLLKNPFYHKIKEFYAEGASTEKLNKLLGKGRAKKGEKDPARNTKKREETAKKEKKFNSEIVFILKKIK